MTNTNAAHNGHNAGANPNVLDLRGLAEPDLLVIDRGGRQWPVPAALSLRTAIELMALEQAAQQAGSDRMAAFGAQVDGLHAVLRLLTPVCTREEVLDAFSLQEIAKLTEWLSFRLAGQGTPPQGAAEGTLSEPATANPQPKPKPNRTQRRARTPQQKSLRSALPVET